MQAPASFILPSAPTSRTPQAAIRRGSARRKEDVHQASSRRVQPRAPGSSTTRRSEGSSSSSGWGRASNPRTATGSHSRSTPSCTRMPTGGNPSGESLPPLLEHRGPPSGNPWTTTNTQRERQPCFARGSKLMQSRTRSTVRARAGCTGSMRLWRGCAASPTAKRRLLHPAHVSISVNTPSHHHHTFHLTADRIFDLFLHVLLFFKLDCCVMKRGARPIRQLS